MTTSTDNKKYSKDEQSIRNELEKFNTETIFDVNTNSIVKPILKLMYNRNKKPRTTFEIIEIIFKNMYITFVDFFLEFISLIACFIIVANIFIRKLLPGDIIYPSDPQKYPYVYYDPDDGHSNEDDKTQRLITHSQLFNKESYSKYETVFNSVLLTGDKEKDKNKINNIKSDYNTIIDNDIIKTIHNPKKEKLNIFASIFQNLNYEKIPSNSWPSSMFTYVLLFTVININYVIKQIMNYLPNIIGLNSDKSYKIDFMNLIFFISIIFLFKFVSSITSYDYSKVIPGLVYSQDNENRGSILGEILFLFMKIIESFVKPFVYILFTALILVYTISLIYTCIGLYKYANAINRGKGSGAILLYLYTNFSMFFIIIKTMMILNELWFTLRNSTCDDTSLFYFIRKNAAKDELNKATKQGGLERLKKAIDVAKDYKINVDYSNDVLDYETDKYSTTQIINNAKNKELNKNSTLNNSSLIENYKTYFEANTDRINNFSEIDTGNSGFNDDLETNVLSLNISFDAFEELYCTDLSLNPGAQLKLRDIPDGFSNNILDIEDAIDSATSFLNEYGNSTSEDHPYHTQDTIDDIISNRRYLNNIATVINNYSEITKNLASINCTREKYKAAAEYTDDKKSLSKSVENKFKEQNNLFGEGGGVKGKQNKKYKKASGNAEKDILDFFREFGEFSRSGENALTTLDMDKQQEIQRSMSTQVSAKHAQIDNNLKGKSKTEKFERKRDYYMTMHIERLQALFPNKQFDRNNFTKNDDQVKYGAKIHEIADYKSVYNDLRKNALFDWLKEPSLIDKQSRIDYYYSKGEGEYGTTGTDRSKDDKLYVGSKFDSTNEGSAEDKKDQLYVLWTLTSYEFDDYISYLRRSHKCNDHTGYKLWYDDYSKKKNYQKNVKNKNTECFMQRIIEGNKIIEGAKFDVDKTVSPSKCSLIQEEKDKKGEETNFTSLFIYYMLIFPILIPMFLPETAAIWKTIEITISLCFGAFYQYENSKEPFTNILFKILSLSKIKLSFIIILIGSIVNIIAESAMHKYSIIRFPTIIIILLTLLTGGFINNG